MGANSKILHLRDHKKPLWDDIVLIWRMGGDAFIQENGARSCVVLSEAKDQDKIELCNPDTDSS